RATRQHPGGRGDFQVRLWYPDRTRNGQFGKWMFGGDQVHLVDDEPKTVPHVHDRSIHSSSGGSCKHQSHRVFLTTNGKRMDLGRRLFVGNRWAYFEHVSA